MSDRLLGAVCVVAAAGMAWAAQGYAAAISYEPVGPRAFPLLLAALMAIAGGWLVIKPTMGGGSFRFHEMKPIVLCALTVLIYAVLFQTLGFTVATALMAVPVGMAFGGSWLQSLAGGVGLGLGLYLLFDKLLDVVLPTGVLSVVFGGH
ncbi:MAG: tripartite tricarboxylate transporter TctB family protein [Burkholderiales bacterium]